MVFNNEPHTHALIDLPTRYAIEDVSRAVHRSGVITIESLKADLPAVVATEPFPFHTLMLESQYIANQEEHHRKQTFRKSTKGMACNGTQRKPLKWFRANCSATSTPT
ncbi:MAG: hypothetical protein ABR568_17615 [Pyrinomonadaceae bacterium]